MVGLQALQTLPALPALEDHSMVRDPISFLKPLYLVDFPALRRHIAAGGCCWRQLQVSERIGCLPRSTDVGDRDKRMYYFIQCVFCCFVAYYFIQLQFVNLNLFGTQCCVRNLRSLPMTAIENQMPEAVLLCCGH